MYRIFEYTVLFVVVVLLQVFLFDNMRIGLFLNPFAYLAFIILLPVEVKGYTLLLLAALTGVAVDFLTGIAGLSTISIVFASFWRPALLKFFLSDDDMDEGGVPNIRKMGVGKFIKYSLLIILLHNTAFFVTEALSFREVLFTATRIAVSTASTLLVVYFCQLLFIVKRTKA